MDTIVVVELLRRYKQFFGLLHHIVIMIIGAISLKAGSVFVEASPHLIRGTHGIVTEIKKFGELLTVNRVMVEHPDIRS